MKTESRNLNFVGVLSVVEKQTYTIPGTPPSQKLAITTDVETSVVFRSRLGERIRGKLEEKAQQHVQEDGWLARFGSRGIQRTIESLASTKTQDQLGKSREGMSMILERLRQTGIIGVLEQRRAAREALAAAH